MLKGEIVRQDELPLRIELLVEQVAAMAVSQVAEAVYQEAWRRSSGNTTKAELRWADYPYAKRHGSPLLDPSIINVHSPTDGFRSQWVKEMGDDPYHAFVFNDSEVADYLQEGTRYAFSRPIAQATEDAVESRMKTPFFWRLES